MKKDFHMHIFNRFAQQVKKSGLFARSTTETRLKKFIETLRPVTCSKKLIRIGLGSDGGYLVPDDLVGIAACFSPGVSDVADFEIDLERRFGIPSYLADFSVSGPPEGLIPAGFLKKYVGAQSDERTITLTEWIESSNFGPPGDLLLQMDIEGSEYETILSTPNEILQQFRIVVVEFHAFGKLKNPYYFDIYLKTVSKLTEIFDVVHLHPNNCCGNAVLKNMEIPRVLEVTFLRKDRVFDALPTRDFPHPLDQRNVLAHEELLLPEIWYR